MKNANAKNDIEFIILTMLISMLFMIFFSSIAIFINSKKFYNIIAFEINKYIHNVIVSIIFVAILGLKDLIAKYIEAGHLFDFPKGSIISTNDIITVIIYMFFVLILCYQHTYIIVNKLIVHKSVSEKPLN